MMEMTDRDINLINKKILIIKNTTSTATIGKSASMVTKPAPKLKPTATK